MNCIQCGNPMADDARFCTVCGTPVAAQQRVQQPVQQPVAAQGQPPMQPQAEAPVMSIPYLPPKMEGGNIIIPMHRRFRILCPDCRHVSNDIKKDATAGYACPVCGKAYAYAAQVLFYRMGSWRPLYVARQINIMIDGVEYGEIANQESVRVLIGPGSHMITCGGYGLQRPMQYKIDVTPEFNTFAFKFNLIYNGPFTYPGRGTSNEFKPCRPEEIPNI